MFNKVKSIFSKKRSLSSTNVFTQELIDHINSDSIRKASKFMREVQDPTSNFNRIIISD